MSQIYVAALMQFLSGFILQIVIWRGYLAKRGHVPRQIVWLFLLFAGIPILNFLTAGSADELVAGLALGGAYIMTFPAASAQSPTILIVDLLDRNGPMSREELLREIQHQADLTQDRLNDLHHDGLASMEAGFQPSPAGRFLGWAFWTYRRILGLPIGEG